jgi:tetratricopeptide (TPR) repeat protein
LRTPGRTHWLPWLEPLELRLGDVLHERARVHYNLGLALQQLGRRQPAEAALLQVQKLDPRDPATCYALAVFYAQGRQYAQALPWAEKLLALDPANAQARQLVGRND